MKSIIETQSYVLSRFLKECENDVSMVVLPVRVTGRSRGGR
jgi:hypothetical protein